MQVPEGVLELVISLTLAAVAKVVFGAINKNEKKSDEADQRLDQKIEKLREDLKEVDVKYRDNDRDIYEKIGDLRVQFTDLKARGKKDV